MKFLPNIRVSHFFIILLGILALSSFLRLWRIEEYMLFLGDEGRDTLVVKRMLLDGKFTLLGPITSVGSMYMGPFYYYLISPFLLVFNFNPVGPSVMVAILSVATVFLIYHLGKKYFSENTGIVGAFFYAISPPTIIYGRSSWNPNVVPFFSIVFMLSVYKIIIEKKSHFMFLSGLMFGILIQLHYTSLYLLFVLIVSAIATKTKISLKSIGLFFIGSIITFSPFIIFELRHEFTNTRAVINFLTAASETKGIRITQIISTIQDVWVRIFWRLLMIVNAEVSKVISLGIVATIIIGYLKKGEKVKELKILISWLFVGIVSFAFYGGIIYDYYFGAMFPIPFILFGLSIDKLRNIKLYGIWIALFLVVTLTYFNIQKNPLLSEPNNLLKNTREIAEFIYKKVEGKPYNFALIAGRNSDHAYRYFLELWGNPPKTIENPTVDPDRKTVTQNLYIVCEEKVCQPLGHPLWEIAGFGRAEIQGEWKVSTARVFHLVRYNKDLK